MSKGNKKIIKYTNRDFNSIKAGLVEYTKRYYPEIFKDFSEASFGSLILDLTSYVGDVLSFYLDYQANESFLDTAIEYDNVLRLGEQVGYKQSLKSNSFGVVTLNILAPADVNGTPDRDYLPKLLKNTRFTTNTGEIYTLIEDVDFTKGDNEVVVATSDAASGNPDSFAVKAYGKVMSGEIKEDSYTVGEFSRFLNVPILDSNITEVVSVVDTEGHEYFEVPFLSQDTVFRSVTNKDLSTRTQTPNILVATAVPRRYTTFVREGVTYLKFGYGSDSSLKTSNVTHPSNVVLKMHGRDYEVERSFDPSKLIESDKFGIAPSNTVLTIKYRANTSENSNLATQSLTNVSDSIFSFGENALNNNKINFVRDSLEVTNEEPIVGDAGIPSLGELKTRINDIFATQNRAVTADDYSSLVYRMPGKFGKIKRAKLVRDHDSFKRNLNLYVISEDADGNLSSSNQVLKNNVKTWLNQYKMVNDTIDILDSRVINIAIKFIAVVNMDQDKFEALNAAINSVESIFKEKLDIGQPIYFTKIYDNLNQLDEIVDVVDVDIELAGPGGLYSSYSLDLNDYISSDGRILYAPENAVYELKYPELDIRGTIR